MFADSQSVSNLVLIKEPLRKGVAFVRLLLSRLYVTKSPDEWMALQLMFGFAGERIPIAVLKEDRYTALDGSERNQMELAATGSKYLLKDPFMFKLLSRALLFLGISFFAVIPYFVQAQGKPPEMILKSYLVADLVIPMKSETKAAPVQAVAFVIEDGKSEACCSKRNYTYEKELINLITQSIAPKSWKDAGGSGVLFYSPVTMSLVVNQHPSVQKQVEDLLKSLRCLQDVRETLQIEKKSDSDCCLADFSFIKNLLVCEKCSADIQTGCCAAPGELSNVKVSCSLNKSGCCKECCASEEASCKGLASCCKLKDACSKTKAVCCQTGKACCQASAVIPPVVNLAVAEKAPVSKSAALCVVVGQKETKITGVCPYLATMETMKAGQCAGCCTELGQVKGTQVHNAAIGNYPVAIASKTKVLHKVSRKSHVLDELCQAYEEACAEGKTKEAAKFARAALSIDPTCFTRKR